MRELRLKNIFPLPNFTRISNEDKSMINRNRFTLYGFMNMKDRKQAKIDFINVAKKLFSSANY